MPVLYLAAAGGFGEAGIHALELLGSTDKTVEIVSLSPPEEFDFAHIDLISADNAMTDVWSRLVSWLETH